MAPSPDGDIRADIAPVDGLAPGDRVRIAARGLPPRQLIGWGQCGPSAHEVADPFALSEVCVAWDTAFSSSAGIVDADVTVQAVAGGFDCRQGGCVVGLVVVNRVQELRVFAEITFDS